MNSLISFGKFSDALRAFTCAIAISDLGGVCF